MDNLFNSANLAHAVYHGLNSKVLIHGVIQKSIHGGPPIVFQEEVMGKQGSAARGTVKTAVLKNDSWSSNLIIASCYDQKLFYMILHSILKLSLVECSKQIWSHELKKVIDFNFLQ